VLGHGWKMQWSRVLRRLYDVRAVYAGREGGTDSAVDTVQFFFEAIHRSRCERLEEVPRCEGTSLTHLAHIRL